MAELIEASDGMLYGTASRGAGGGTVFRLSKDGNSYLIVHTFLGGADGCSPEGGLVEGLDGYFYGTTAGGTSPNVGNIFKVSKDGSTFVALHQFTGLNGDGIGPRASLLRASDGRFYGTTELGGVSGAGTAFVLDLNSPPARGPP
jgi:uncharacterized repeat protein (TIGR03803 family)